MSRVTDDNIDAMRYVTIVPNNKTNWHNRFRELAVAYLIFSACFSLLSLFNIDWLIKIFATIPITYIAYYYYIKHYLKSKSNINKGNEYVVMRETLDDNGNVIYNMNIGKFD